jgi:hypothetical protein
MSHRQLAGEDGHRWDVEDEGPLDDRGVSQRDGPSHQLRFRRDDGAEEIRAAPRGLDQLADLELRALLQVGSVDDFRRGPDTPANETGGYGDARD